MITKLNCLLYNFSTLKKNTRHKICSSKPENSLITLNLKYAFLHNNIMLILYLFALCSIITINIK